MKKATYSITLILCMGLLTGCKTLGALGQSLGGKKKAPPRQTSTSPRQTSTTPRQNNRQHRAKYDRLIKNYGSLIPLLRSGKNKTFPKQYIRPRRMYRYVQKLEGFSTFADWCKTGEYKGLAKTYRDRNFGPQEACTLAKDWKTHFLSFTNLFVDKETKSFLRKQRYYVKRLREKNKLSEKAQQMLNAPREFIAKKRKAYAKAYEQLGAKMPVIPQEKFDRFAKDYKRALRQSARGNHFPTNARYKDSSCHNAFRDAGQGAGLRLIRSGMLFSSWSIKKNRLGTPLRRIRTGYGMFRKQDEGFCRIYRLTAVGQYQGGGTYAPAAVRRFSFKSNSFVVSKCKP